MSAVDLARQQWDEGHRRFQVQAADPELADRLVRQLDVATEELRKRVGETFTLAQLADVYGGADGWMREAVANRIDTAGWVRELSLVQDAAFHNYARGAIDYSP
jgi:hypothetical protein